MTPDDVEAMLAAGADLVQLQTGYLYEGPQLLKDICNRLIPQPEEPTLASAETPAEEQNTTTTEERVD